MDIPKIIEKPGMSNRFEVIIPDMGDRAHCPLHEFHIFTYQINMCLRLPIPHFRVDFCEHVTIIPLQLALNSFSFLLALGVLLRYFEVPISTYTLMQLVQYQYMYISLCSNDIPHLLSVSPNTHPLLLHPDKNEEQVEEEEQELFWGWRKIAYSKQGLQEANGAPAPFDDEWKEEPEEDPEEEEIEEIPVGEGEIMDE
ncbi:hypothetical protein F511_30531 [Dorcoceras hygrometricum]|uniref:Uncharacterized protein n=1 Tax=Dorcoceras hygrometricum TaxID=472368 RepID=A0A2Z7BGQ7_9LAMI|nr:hypothetical protein F511_30531 [Dorcoceras hygrometricum]